ncbi:MAG: succinate dehydrogenase assembly factor 2 [Pseudomonadota bacterium]
MGEADARAHLARLRWRCRRGMRELDVVLSRYLDQHYGAAPHAQQAAFESLLELSDPELFDLLRGRTEASDKDGEAIVAELRRTHSG